MLSHKTIMSLRNKSTVIESQTSRNFNSGDLYGWVDTLYHHPSKGYWHRREGTTVGGVSDSDVVWLSRDEALEFLSLCTDAVTGYGWSPSQMQRMLDLEPVGKGWWEDGEDHCSYAEDDPQAGRLEHEKRPHRDAVLKLSVIEPDGRVADEEAGGWFGEYVKLGDMVSEEICNELAAERAWEISNTLNVGSAAYLCDCAQGLVIVIV